MTPDEASEPIPADIRKLSFEKALQELEEIVRRLEGSEVSLEESIATYTRGTQLKRHCESKLASAREQVERIELKPGGVPVATMAIGGGKNAGLMAVSILATHDAGLRRKLHAYKRALAAESRQKGVKLRAALRSRR